MALQSELKDLLSGQSSDHIKLLYSIRLVNEIASMNNNSNVFSTYHLAYAHMYINTSKEMDHDFDLIGFIKRLNHCTNTTGIKDKETKEALNLLFKYFTKLEKKYFTTFNKYENCQDLHSFNCEAEKMPDDIIDTI